jgi:glutamate synthase domain-containing protein 1
MVLERNEQFESDELDFSEHDSCGIGAVVDLNRCSTREIVQLALRGLVDMEARGGSIDGTGDGAGIMVRTHGLRKFLERQLPSLQNAVPANEEIYSGLLFFRQEEAPNIREDQDKIDQILRQRGLKALGWRNVPTNPSVIGARARETMPIIWQLIFAQGQQTPLSIGEALHTTSLLIEREVPGVYPVSMEPGTMVWKAMATSAQLAEFFPDLKNPDFKTDAALWHRRFSTNALARWILAQPFYLLGHNGEINSIRAMREAARDLKRYLRIPQKILLRGGSDSGDLDRIAKLFHSRGVPLSETMRRLVQPAADAWVRFQQLRDLPE